MKIPETTPFGPPPKIKDKFVTLPVGSIVNEYDFSLEYGVPLQFEGITYICVGEMELPFGDTELFPQVAELIEEYYMLGYPGGFLCAVSGPNTGLGNDIFQIWLTSSLTSVDN